MPESMEEAMAGANSALAHPVWYEEMHIHIHIHIHINMHIQRKEETVRK